MKTKQNKTKQNKKKKNSRTVVACSCGVVHYMIHSFIFININKGPLCKFLELFLMHSFPLSNSLLHKLQIPSSSLHLWSLSPSFSEHPAICFDFIFLLLGLEGNLRVQAGAIMGPIHLFSSYKYHSPMLLFPVICWITAGEQVWNNLLWYYEGRSHFNLLSCIKCTQSNAV